MLIFVVISRKTHYLRGFSMWGVLGSLYPGGDATIISTNMLLEVAGQPCELNHIIVPDNDFAVNLGSLRILCNGSRCARTKQCIAGSYARLSPDASSFGAERVVQHCPSSSRS